MADNEISNLINELKNQTQQSRIERLRFLVGTDEQLTDMLIEHLETVPPSPEHLDVCGLILLEKAERIKPIIRKTFSIFPEAIPGFINELLESPFYAQRQAIPSLIVNSRYNGVKKTLRKCLEDPEVSVVRNAALVLGEYEEVPFDDDELIEIAVNLNNHYSEYVQCVVPDVLVLIRQPALFLSELCSCNSWRRRHAVAKKVDRFDPHDRAIIYALLSQDPEDETRICLAKNMGCIDDWSVLAPQFLKDDSPAVRALAVKMVGNREEFQELLKEVASDSSWEVKRELLCVQRSETYRSVSIPLINSLNITPNWRVRKEVLRSIALISRNNEGLLKDFLSQHLLKYLHDSIFELRMETAKTVKELIPMYSWTIEWLPKIEAATTSRNYLHRITAANAALEFDRVYKTVFTKRLLADTVDNVRLYVLDIINMKDVDEETKGMIAALSKSEDEEIRKSAVKLFNIDQEILK